MSEAQGIPEYDYHVIFGTEANCTLSTCDIEWTVFKYRPSLPANAIFLALFALSILIHVAIGIRWRSWWFMGCMIAGSIIEVIGYSGRLIMYNNPWDFSGFLIQIILITIGPVFYTGAIYVTLSKTIYHLGPALSRFPPKLFYWIFIPADILCLVLQSVGGAMSTDANEDTSMTGVDVSLAGLGLQVAVIVIFIACFADYLIRYLRKNGTAAFDGRSKTFFSFLSLAILTIFIRCAYRCYELSDGYNDSDRITNEGEFIGLESVMIVIAVFSLAIGHPGFFLRHQSPDSDTPEKLRKHESSDGALEQGQAHHAHG